MPVDQKIEKSLIEKHPFIPDNSSPVKIPAKVICFNAVAYKQEN